MSYKPLISKIRCHNPNLKSARHANRANLHYIATREGVDHSEISDEKQDNQMYKHASDEEYTRYIAKRPRSHGLFGNIDTEDLKSVEQLVYETSKQGKNVYRGIISLGEQDAQELGYTNSKIWYQQLNSLMPDIAKELGISPTNFTWIGAFHAEPSHPHVHYQLWDNTDKIKSSFLHVSVQKRCRAVIEKSIFSEEYEKTLQAVFEAEREELYSLKNESRENITNYFKEVMNMAHVPGIQHTDLPSKLPAKDAEKIAKHLDTLQDILPASGRMNYKFMPPEVKKNLDKISDLFFRQPDMKAALSQYLQATNQIHQISSPGYSKQTQDNAKKEIYRRTGNIILKNMNNVLSDISHAEEDYEKKILSSIAESDAERSSGDSLSDSSVEQTYTDSDIAYKDEVSGTASLPGFEGNDIGTDIVADTKISLPSSGYIMEWTPQYRRAISLLYDEKNFADAIPILSAEAEKGNVLAIVDLGKMYYRGIGVESDLEIAENYYKQAFIGFSSIDKTNPNAYCSYRLGKLYEAGLGTTQDLFAASHYYTIAAADEKSYAEYSLGKLYLSHNKEFSERFEVEPEAILNLAEKNLKSAADKGFPYGAYEYAKLHDGNSEISNSYYKKAYDGFKQMLTSREDDTLLYRIGKMTLEGKGTLPDVKAAIEYFEKAAELNNVFAKLALAKIQLSNDYFEFQDIDNAIQLLENLVDLKHPEAQYTLGKFYLSEDFPEYQDISKAIELFTASADQGNQFAQYTLGKIFLSEEYPDFRDVPKAMELLSASADQGNQFAQYALGKFYLSEDFPEYRNVPKAMELLSASAEQGNQFAQYTLGKIFLSEDFPKYRNILKAIELLAASVKQGNQFAQYALGKFYLSEDFPEYRNVPKAMELLSASAEQGNQFAQLKLGTIYLYGKYSIPKNEELGKKYLKESTDQGNTYAKDLLQNYELTRSPMYVMASLIYRGLYASMMTNNRRKQQQLEEMKWELSKQARIEKRKQEEITHL